jgi:hypothetical protein
MPMMDVQQVRALLKDSQYDAAIAEARAARDAHKDDRSVREVTTPSKHNHFAELSAAASCRLTRCKPCCVVMPYGASLTVKPKDISALGCAGPTRGREGEEDGRCGLCISLHLAGSSAGITAVTSLLQSARTTTRSWASTVMRRPATSSRCSSWP